MMKYCNETTLKHICSQKWPEIIQNACQLLIDEGCKLGSGSPFSFCEAPVINGDKLEEFFCYTDGRNLSCKNRSVDIIFACKSNVGNEMIFVELKLNTQNVYRLNKLSFREKIQASARALGSSVRVNRKYYLIFDKTVLNEAKRFLFRINPKLDNDFVAIDVIELYSKFFS